MICHCYSPIKSDARPLSLRISPVLLDALSCCSYRPQKTADAMNRRGVIPERAIEISTDLSGVVIYSKSIIQNLNQLLDALSNRKRHRRSVDKAGFR